MSLAGTDDVAVRLGRSLSSAESDQAQAFLDDAEVLIRQRIPDLDARTAADSAFADLVVMVEVRSARRVMQNPDGARTDSVSIDDYQRNRTLDGAISTGEVYISDDEWAQLLGLRTGGAFQMWVGYP